MPYKIITHNGKAHMDELLASALLSLYLEEEPESIERMDSQDAANMAREENLPDDTYFIDCGMVYDGRRKLYDHHQDRELDSAALLLFNELFPRLIGTDLHNFIMLVSRVDTKGAMSLNDFNLIGESRDYLSFSHKILLRTFEKDPILILKIFTAGLEDKIKFETDRAKAVLWLKETGHVEIIKIEKLNILNYLIKPPSALVSPLRSAITEVVEESNISAILSFDDKQPGVQTFYRTDSGHELVDFSRCRPSETIFNHQGGFLMKFIPEDGDEWIKLIQQAVL
ncbi:MAG: MYG1 family protein [Spirochaetales bacterium]|nr:MYG1 family protein [Spirochaetales bacterium]